MRIPVSTRTSYSTADKVALVDSGATDNFMHPNFAARMGLKPAKLERPRKIWNVDNTENEAGMITHYLDLDVETKGIHKVSRSALPCLRSDSGLATMWASASSSSSPRSTTS